jgi:hypothetical protein
MAAVDPEHMLEVAAAEDEDPVEAVSADGADPSLGVGVRVRCLHWGPGHLQALGAEHLVEGVAELRVAMDQEPDRLLLAELHGEVARLLRRPSAVRVGRAGEVLDPSARGEMKNST